MCLASWMMYYVSLTTVILPVFEHAFYEKDLQRHIGVDTLANSRKRRANVVSR